MDTVSQMVGVAKQSTGCTDERLLTTAMAGIVAAQHDVVQDINRLLANTIDDTQLKTELLMLRDKASMSDVRRCPRFSSGDFQRPAVTVTIWSRRTITDVFVT